MAPRDRSGGEPATRAGFIATGCAFALTVASIDLIAALMRLPRADYSDIRYMLPPLAASTVLGIGVYIPIAMFAAIAARLLRRPVNAVLVPILIFTATLFLFAVFTDLLPWTILDPVTSKGDMAVQLAFGAALAGLAAAGGFVLIARYARDMPRRVRAASAIPFALVAAVAAVWLQKFQIESFVSAASLAVVAVFGVAIIILAILFALIGPRTRTAFLLAATALLLLSPLTVIADIPAAQRAPVEQAAGTRAVSKVILVVVDTLRADALGSYGGNGVTTPNLDAFAQDAVRFEHAISGGPWTVPGMGSIMTGLNVLTHDMTEFGSDLPDAAPSLAEHMSAAGYRTRGIGHNGNLSAKQGYHRGFDEFTWFPQLRFLPNSVGAATLAQLFPDAICQEPTTTQLVEWASAWAGENRTEDLFMWLHIYDPHMPYTPPPEYTPQGPPPKGLTRAFSTEDGGRAMTGKLGRTEEERAWIRKLYDAEVTYVDAELGRFFDQLKAWEIYDESLIVLTSDHGEEFWEHGGFEHGQSLHQELIHVPLLIKLPGSTKTGSVTTTVSTDRIVPTILALCGLSQGDGVIGPSLVAHAGNENVEEALPAVSSGMMRGGEQHGVVHSGYSYMKNVVNDREKLFDLDSDPHELHNLRHNSDAPLETYRGLLQKERAAAQSLRNQLGITQTAPALDRETEDALKSMGYID